MKTDDVTRGNEEVLAARIDNGSQMRIGAIGWDTIPVREEQRFGCSWGLVWRREVREGASSGTRRSRVE